MCIQITTTWIMKSIQSGLASVMLIKKRINTRLWCPNTIKKECIEN